ISYHPGKTNVVAGALSRKIRLDVVCLWNSLETLSEYQLQTSEGSEGICFSVTVVTSSLVQQVLEA
ncbi:hypothetical protein U1Q18_039418, partial [Sarracenia purpurea var. burkii]